MPQPINTNLDQIVCKDFKDLFPESTSWQVVGANRLQNCCGFKDQLKNFKTKHLEKKCNFAID